MFINGYGWRVVMKLILIASLIAMFAGDVGEDYQEVPSTEPDDDYTYSKPKAPEAPSADATPKATPKKAPRKAPKAEPEAPSNKKEDANEEEEELKPGVVEPEASFNSIYTIEEVFVNKDSGCKTYWVVKWKNLKMYGMYKKIQFYITNCDGDLDLPDFFKI